MDDELVRRAQRGDRDAFTSLAAARVDSLYATAFRILRDHAMAEDALQDALLAAWRKLPQLREVGRLDAWLYRLVVNECKGQLARRRSARAHLVVLGSETPASERGPAAGVEQRDAIERAFARLSVEHRAVVVLRHYLSWSPTDIATTLGISTGTVSSRLHYAMRAMRAALEADARTATSAGGRTG